MADLVRINRDRLARRLSEMAKIGATPAGGVTRLAFTDLDKEGRDLFIRWCEARELSVRIDEMGNIFARYGADDQPPVMAGSHLDSQPQGGKYDGAYGVLAAFEAVETLMDAGITPSRPIEAVCWSNEEGSRFPPPMIGSGVFAGLFDRDDAYARESRDGKKQGDELARIGYRGESACRAGDIHRYFELHIEQGPVLDQKGLRIGIVEGVYGLKWLELTIRGEANHAGATPMEVRRDALAAAAEIITRAERLPADMGGNFRLTVGYIAASPNSTNVIPGEVVFTVDVRSEGQEGVEALARSVTDIADEIASRRNVELEIQTLSDNAPVTFAPECRDLVEQMAAALELPRQRMHSGPGHDAVYLSHVCPTGMIFVPSIDGISHNEYEETTPDDLAAGADVLANVLRQSAET
ncbi:MAG: Zn-dependent hydrolase [Alphaproteobacteria bacterium]